MPHHKAVCPKRKSSAMLRKSTSARALHLRKTVVGYELWARAGTKEEIGYASYGTHIYDRKVIPRRGTIRAAALQPAFEIFSPRHGEDKSEIDIIRRGAPPFFILLPRFVVPPFFLLAADDDAGTRASSFFGAEGWRGRKVSGLFPFSRVTV